MSAAAPLDRHSFAGSTRVVSGTFQLQDSARLTGEVILTFPDGTDWAYSTVPVEVWERMKQATSAGEFLAAELDAYSKGPA